VNEGFPPSIESGGKIGVVKERRDERKKEVREDAYSCEDSKGIK
jgi:hypothetical protein